MKKLCLLLAGLTLICALTLPVFAAQSNEPVHIAGNTYYDPVENAFLYYVNSSQMIRSNVADGMITENPVTVSANAGIALDVYLNGERLEGTFGGTFRTAGEYVVMYVGGTVSERIFSFTIVPQLCNYVTSYAIPAGFEITAAYCDDVEIAYDKKYVKLAEDGAYTVHYRCVKTGIPYQLTVRTDFTGPTLSLTGVIDGKARGPVDISEARQAAVVNIFHDGEKIGRKDVLTESGEYYIELADEAGNKTSYSFTILIYFDGSSWLYFLVLGAVAIGMVIYLLHARKHLRVR